MADLFDLPITRMTKGADSSVLKKSTTKKSAPISFKGGSLFERISTIVALLESKLGKYRDDYLYFMANDEEKFKEYIYNIKQLGIASIDTETTGLDVFNDHIVGLSLYSKTLKPLYIPIHHKSYITMTEIEGQLESKFIAEQLQSLVDVGVKFEYYNAPFDIKVLKHNLGIYVPAWYDAHLGAYCLNENEPHGLKNLHSKYVLNGKEDEFSFGQYFKDICFDLIPIDPGYLYASRDAIDTDELVDFQLPYLTPGSDLCTEYDLEGPAKVFWNIEMPYVDVIVDLEETGIKVDTDYAQQLSVKYHALEQQKLEEFYEILKQYKPQIDAYKRDNPNHKLSDPISVSSPTQLAILFYDILKVPVVDKDKPRGTGEEILAKIDNPLCKAITDYRGVSKLLSTYIDALPQMLKSDGRIHAKFNQYGAKTGRLSSDEPNMQNIPSHNKDIRKMFTAGSKEYEVSSDTNTFSVKSWAEVMTSDGWKFADKICCGDILITANETIKVVSINRLDNNIVEFICSD